MSSIASLFHYKNIQPQNNLKLRGSNSFIKDIKDDERFGINVLDLKKYLLSQNINIRI